MKVGVGKMHDFVLLDSVDCSETCELLEEHRLVQPLVGPYTEIVVPHSYTGVVGVERTAVEVWTVDPVGFRSPYLVPDMFEEVG